MVDDEGKGNLDQARAALDAVENATTTLRRFLDAEHADMSDPGVYFAAQVEIARTVRKSAGLLCMYLACEALERGTSPAMLDWPDDPEDGWPGAAA